MLLLSLLLLLNSVWINDATNTNFVQVPMDQNSTLGSTVQFVCRISNENNCLLIWRFAGSSEGRNIHTSGRTSTLTIDAVIANNGTIIECGCRYSSTNIDYTSPVQLRVQGLLESPTNVHSLSTASTIELMWTPPVTLDLTGIQPDITGYKITVENVNTGNLTNFTASSPLFTLVREDFVHCDTFRLSVLGLNILGEGKQSNHISAQYLGRHFGTYVPRVSRLECISNAATIMTDLTNVSVELGDRAVLNCSAPCNAVIAWFLNNQQTHESITRTQCNNGYFSESLSVYTESNDTVVQCTAISVCTNEDVNCTPLACRSRKAYVTVLGENFEQSTDNEEIVPTLSSVTTLFETLTVDTDEVSITTPFKNNNTPSTTTTTTSTTSSSVDNGANVVLIIGIGAAVGGCFLILCIVLMLLLVIVIAAKYNEKQKPKMTSDSNVVQENNDSEAIYESASKVEAYIPRAVNINSGEEQAEPYYSLPLPTGNCAAYGALKKTLNN